MGGRSLGALLSPVAIGFGALAAVLAWAGPAEASYVDADTRCTVTPNAPVDPALSARLEAKAEQIEQLLVGGATRLRDALALTGDLENGRRATDRALARFCIAMGEAARVDPASGGLAQATRLLSRGYRAALDSGEPPLAARAAYQLALTSIHLRSPLGGAAAEGDCETLLSNAWRTLSLNADTALQCAARSAQGSGQASLAGRAYLRLARFRLVASESALSPALLRRAAGDAALDGLRDVERIGADAGLVGRLAETALDAGVSDPIVARAVGTMSGGASVQAYAAALRARLELARGSNSRAAAELQRAIQLEMRTPAPVRLPDWYMQLALADPTNAQQHVAAAYRALSNVRDLMPSRDPYTEESLFAWRMRPVFEAALEYDLPANREIAGRIGSAQRVLEGFRQSEIESIFGSDCVPPIAPVDINQLRDNEIVLYPVVLRGRVEVIYALRDENGVQYRRARPSQHAMSRAEAARLVRTMNSSLSASSSQRDWEDPAGRLYEQLIRSEIEAAIRARRDAVLIIVPDTVLRGVPFAALRDQGGDFLVSKANLAVAPALAYAQPGRDAAGRRSRFASVSLEAEVEIAGTPFPVLSNVGREASFAAGPRGRPMRNFTRSQLEEVLRRGDVDVLHVATHAAFEGGVERSFIVANGPAGRGEFIPISALRSAIQTGRVRGELDLLVLSACETAVDDDQASMGLAGAAVRAGARSALASLWQVSDASAADLMEAFYQNYRSDNISKARALAEAQRRLIESDAYTHPRHWAGFVLIGGWR